MLLTIWFTPEVFYGADLSQFATIQFSLCGIFLGGHLWHAIKAKAGLPKFEGNILSDKDMFSTIMTTFLVLSVIVISLILLSAKP